MENTNNQWEFDFIGIAFSRLEFVEEAAKKAFGTSTKLIEQTPTYYKISDGADKTHIFLKNNSTRWRVESASGALAGDGLERVGLWFLEGLKVDESCETTRADLKLDLMDMLLEEFIPRKDHHKSLFKGVWEFTARSSKFAIHSGHSSLNWRQPERQIRPYEKGAEIKFRLSKNPDLKLSERDQLYLEMQRSGCREVLRIEFELRTSYARLVDKIFKDQIKMGGKIINDLANVAASQFIKSCPARELP